MRHAYHAPTRKRVGLTGAHGKGEGEGASLVSLLLRMRQFPADREKDPGRCRLFPVYQGAAFTGSQTQSSGQAGPGDSVRGN